MQNKNAVVTNFLMHLHPKTVNMQAVKFTRTFGLGGINALLFVILATTGLLLRFSYVPTPNDAYNSILSLQNNSIFGSLLRNIHHWSAILMVVTAFLHLLRVFYTGSIYYERKKNWHYGLALFALVLAFNFTGYLLPWDQLSFWAVTIMTNILEYIPFIGNGFASLIRGGETVNGNTLLNFYNFHTALLPLLFVVFMVIHFWLVRKAKGVTVANNTNKITVKVNPDLIRKEIITALVLLVSILLFSIFFDAPLLEKANPLVSPNPSKAPWYFMGIQELLINLHPVFVSSIIPILVIIFFIYISKLQINKDKIGVWFYSKEGRKIIIVSAIFASILVKVLTISFEYFINLSTLNIPLYISTGIIPLFMYLIPISVFIFYLKFIKKANKTELVLALVTILFTSYLVMSFVGICLRGDAMHLIF